MPNMSSKKSKKLTIELSENEFMIVGFLADLTQETPEQFVQRVGIGSISGAYLEYMTTQSAMPKIFKN